MDIPINSLSTKDIAQATSCPAKLYWRYQGVLKGTHPCTRTVSPVELGKKGEQDILSLNTPVNELANRHFSNYDLLPFKTVKLTTLKERYNSIIHNISLIERDDDKPIDAEYDISKIGIQAKEKYDLSVVIPKVRIYNPVYHYHGIPDFIGLKKDGSTILIDSKNAERTTNYDEVQMNLYLDSFNKRYLTPSSLQELHNVIDTILFQEKGGTFLKLVKDDVKNQKILNEIFEKIDDIEVESSKNKYGKKIEDLKKTHERIQNDIDSKLFDLRAEKKKELIDIIVHQEPEYGVIFNTRHTDKTKEITDVKINLPDIVKSAWKIKKNLLTEEKEFVIDRESCNGCLYKNHCHKNFEIIEPEDIKDPAIPTLLHKAFNSYERKEKIEITQFQDFKVKKRLNYFISIKNQPEKYIPNKYLKDFKKETLQEIISKQTQLKGYALAKQFNKIDKEFRFWDIK